MKRMIDAEKFLDKLLYMGYMDEQKSEVEEVANRMTEDAYTQADMVAMLTEIQLQMEEYEPKWAENEDQVIASNRTWEDFDDIIQQKINALKGGDYDKR